MTTNSGSIPPLFCSTPPPDDNFVDTQLDEEDFDDEYQRNQISAQTPEFSKDVVIEKMSTFSLCDDDDIVEYNYLKIPFSKETDDDNPLDFIIQEIKTIDNDLETDETKVQHFNAQFDEGPNEISDQFTDDDFGVFQSRSQFEDVLHAQDDSSIDKIQTGEEKLHDLSSQEDEEAALQNGVQTSSSNTPYDSIVHQEIEDIQTNIEDIEHKVKDIIPKDEENENKVQNNSNLDDFDDFQSISISKNNISTIVKLPMEEPQAVQFEADFNQFSAFEDNNDTQIKSEEVEDEFDDFQDFTSAPALKSQDSELFPPYVPDTTNISERITSIIKIMFPEDSTPAENVEPVVKLGPSSMIINPVDSALALEFQWNKSEMRHFLMKSIGIDIRGADLHENWNPSMPRFAANLGAVPLEPLKPVKTDISQANPMPINEATNLQVVDPAKVSDIPVVEFNLNRFSTDNPLDASQAHTLLLDLDQVVMKANKLNDCSYSCSSSPCSTSITDKLLGPSTKKIPIINNISPQTGKSTNTNIKCSTNNFKTNYYDKYLDRFSNLIGNYQTITTSPLGHFDIKPVFYGNSDGLNEIFQHGDEFSNNLIYSTKSLYNCEWEKQHFLKSPSDINKFNTNKTSNNNVDCDFLTFTDADFSKLKNIKCGFICSACMFFLYF
ncbi:AFTPH family protein [Megaselia abdita]